MTHDVPVSSPQPLNLSILDLAPVVAGSTPAQALRNTGDLARHAEAWGYRRYWLAEHHNMEGIASAATAVATLTMLSSASEESATEPVSR